MSWHQGVFHVPTGEYYQGSGELGRPVTLRLRVPEDAPVLGVYLRSAPDGEERTTPAQLVAGRPGYRCRWWEVVVTPDNRRFHYRFLLRTSEGGWWYTASGLHRSVPSYHTDFQLLLDWSHSEWQTRAIYYQIFPDRFSVGDSSTNVKEGQHQVDGHPAVVKSWGDLPDLHQGGREFYGGDLPGIEARLDYLHEELGVTALYLNPIFTAPSSHKYDAASYHQVDPHFGGDAAFLSLSKALKQRKMRVILDIVPNHCGIEHPWFQQALSDPNAETAEYFTFHNHPHDYECWLAIKSLPKLNYRSGKLRQAMYEAPDSIFRRWLDAPFDVDGWRVDVANMLGRKGGDHLGHKVLRGMRRAVKETRPDGYFLGENFFDASSYLQGDQLDATMNYRGFMMPLYHWLAGRDYHSWMGHEWGDSHALPTENFEAQLSTFRATIPWDIVVRQFNLLDSHDTPRLLTLMEGDMDKAAVARFLLFTYPGVPSVYYGDEVGVDGGRDPDNRRCMPWNRESWDTEWWEGWRELIRHRKALQALNGGAYQTLLAQQHTLAFLREAPGARVICVARRAPDEIAKIPVEAAAVPDGTIFRELLGGGEARVEGGSLPLGPAGTQLWVEI